MLSIYLYTKNAIYLCIIIKIEQICLETMHCCNSL